MLKFRAKKVDLEAGGKKLALLSKDGAAELGVHANDRVMVTLGNKTETLLVDTTQKFVGKREIGLFNNTLESYDEEFDGWEVTVEPAKPPRSATFVKKRLLGAKLSPEEIKEIIQDIVDNRLSDIEAVFFMASCYGNDFTEDEISALADGMVEAGRRLDFPGKTVLSKHCTGGVPGNRTTMVVIPIVVASGLTMAKTSSRAISSPAGTADVMEVLCSVEHTFDEVTNIVNTVGGCMIWNGAVQLSPADDKLNQLRNPMRLDPRPFLLSSIMSKKKAEGAKRVLIDIPIGRGGKFETEAAGRELAEQFIRLGRNLGLQVEVVLTAGDQPIGNGIGPALEARDVIRVLEGSRDLPDDLRQKAVTLAGLLLEMGGKAETGKGKILAEEILASGRALSKFHEIVLAQGGEKPTVEKVEKVLGTRRAKVIAETDCSVFSFDNPQITKIARAAGAPKNKGAGIYLFVKKGSKVRKGEPLYEIYSEQEDKLAFALSVARENNGIIFQKSVLEVVS